MFFFCVFVLGTVLWIYSLTMEYYTDPEKMEEIALQVDLSPASKFGKLDYWEARKTLETDKRKYMDLGSGLMIASGLLFFFFLFQRVKTVRDLNRVRSLKPIWLIGLTYFVWLSGHFWIRNNLNFRQSRGDFPWFADSIIIPLVEVSLLIDFGCILLLILFVISLPNSRTGVPIFVRIHRFSFSKVLWELFFDGLLLITLYITGIMIYYGVHGFILIFLFMDYLLLSLRAGRLHENSHKIKENG